MPDHSILIWIGDGATFQFVHRGKSLFNGPGHLLKVVVGKIQPAQVKSEANLRVSGVQGLVPLPQFKWIICHE